MALYKLSFDSLSSSFLLKDIKELNVNRNSAIKNLFNVAVRSTSVSDEAYLSMFSGFPDNIKTSCTDFTSLNDAERYIYSLDFFSNLFKFDIKKSSDISKEDRFGAIESIYSRVMNIYRANNLCSKESLLPISFVLRKIFSNIEGMKASSTFMDNENIKLLTEQLESSFLSFVEGFAAFTSAKNVKAKKENVEKDFKLAQTKLIDIEKYFKSNSISSNATTFRSIINEKQ
jgi:hypothetical protein